MTLTIVAPDGREHAFDLDARGTVLDAARAAAEHFDLGVGPWTLTRGPRSLAAVMPLETAGAQDGERLELRHW